MNAARRDNKAVAFSDWVYRRLLALYPRAHREEYGGAMAQLFRDQCRDSWQWARGWGLAWLWLRVLPELARTAAWERLTNRRERKYMFRKMSAGFREKPALLGIFFAVFVGVFGLVALTSTIITFILPEAYASKARIKVEREVGGASNVAGQPAMTGIYDPNLIQTEIQVIQSEKVLDQVIERLDLNSVWAAKYNSPSKLKSAESRLLLKRMIDVRPSRNTSLIDITVLSDDKAEAAKIANTIAEVYQTSRRQRHEILASAAMDEFKKLKDELRSELADKTNDPKVVDEKITETIARAGQAWNGKLHEAVFAGIPTETVEIIEHAEPGFRPVRPNKPLNIFIGLVIGAFAGVLAGGAAAVIVGGHSYWRLVTALEKE